ncbi:PPOX class F420-dependent oxidoreductase [Cellulomonas endophytica]|uniref:PPOX class F420-dependent oxidoreductase n=1 Tax=Cellulomonas endophytica TaxID=2494735 RepID=UPI00196B4D02|nr:PPOX class F420-dependent oxidoreductase [Cellulomonas endophytica]
MPLTTELAALAEERFVELTTFRRDGTSVGVPVWVARDGEALVVTTPAGSGKVKRLRRDPRVLLRPCGRRGGVEPDAPVVAGVAAVEVEDEAARAHRDAVFGTKYGMEYRVVLGVEKLGRGTGERVLLRITAP